VLLEDPLVLGVVVVWPVVVGVLACPVTVVLEVVAVTEKGTVYDVVAPDPPAGVQVTAKLATSEAFDGMT